MSLRSWWSPRKHRKRLGSASEASKDAEPLREFVYLDAVSLHSLLVSQKATIPENVSEAMTEAAEAELKGSATTEAILAKGEFAARFQTSNSNNVQTSRKAIVQTLFKEFRELPLDFKLAGDGDLSMSPQHTEALSGSATDGTAWAATDIRRGDLVEIQVALAVDPVFKLGSMMSEWTGMANDLPEMFTAQGLLGVLRDAQPIMKVLDRFLAGLIPIKATATDHVVVENGGGEYVVRSESVRELDLPTWPLRIVGVTEHLGYWKDIRRVLFSDGRFTMLCRVARDGIHTSWTPVKLADLFSDVAPDLVDRINAIEFSDSSEKPLESPRLEASALGRAVMTYKDWLVSRGESSWSEDADAQLGQILNRYGDNVSATSQRELFNDVRDHVVRALSLTEPSSEEDLQARERARDCAGLTLFPSIALPTPFPSSYDEFASPSYERLLDVEVIAIYW